jgi:hypothetical protein
VTVADVFNRFAVNLGAAVSDGAVWQAVAVCLLSATLVFALGYGLARLVGVLDAEAPDSEVLAVGLGVGLLASSVAWATVASGGRSAFTPPALAIVVAAVVAIRARTHRKAGDPAHGASQRRLKADRLPLRLSTVLAAGSFVVAIGLTYASTMSLSPRNGGQPIEFTDEAYYSLLSEGVNETGLESIYWPAGIANTDVPSQTWYHWGEVWLGSAVISISGLPSLDARHVVVLPIILLAAVALTGSLARRLNETRSRAAFAFGAASALFLAPVPIPGGLFGFWARGNVFGVTMYGLALIIVLLIALGIATFRTDWSRARTWFAAATIASLLPAHVLLAGLGAVGAAATLGIWWGTESRRGGMVAQVPPNLMRLALVTGVLLVATLGWGVVTDHRIGASGLNAAIPPFASAWSEGVLKTTLASGLFVAIPLVAWLHRKSRGALFWLCICALVIWGLSAVAWGARVGDFTMFHVFYGGIAAFATPVAAAAVVDVARRVGRSGNRVFRAALALAVIAQFELGVVTAVLRLEEFGPADVRGVPISLLQHIESLPQGAKLAYACQPQEEIAYWSPRLIGLFAHTGKAVVPMCFQAEALTDSIQHPSSQDVASVSFESAPQREIYPTAASRPSSSEVAAFLKQHGVAYIYADALHPNTLVDDAVPVMSVGEFQLLRIQ